MTPDEVRELVATVQRQRCESESVEVKTARQGTPLRAVREALSAFANRPDGGVLLFGLDEAAGFEVVGVGDVQRLQEQIVNAAANEMGPPLRPAVSVAGIDGKSVVAIEVAEVPAEQKPCYVKTAGLTNGSYVRVGASNRRMTDYEVFGHVSSRQQPEFDVAPVVGSTVEDLDPGALTAYLGRVRQDRPNLAALGETDAELLSRLGVLRRVDGDLRPTLAGLLVFGRYPQQFEPQLVVTFLQYYGIDDGEPAPDGARFLDNQKFEGPLPLVVEQAIGRVLSRIRQSSLIEGILRRDIPEYPDVAIREAVVNAVAHRDYSHFARGSQVQIRLFADRLEIRSPGGLHGSVTVDTLDEVQSTRNRVLVRLLKDLRFVENRGSGIRSMVEAMRHANLEPPSFDVSLSTFKVIFHNHTLMNPEAIEWLNQYSWLPLNERQRVALVFARQHERLTNSDYRRLNRVDSTTATREPRGMVQAGAVEQRGTYRGAYYALLLSPSAAWVAANQEQERIVAFIRQHGSIDNEQCRTLLEATPRRASYLLGNLVDSGVLERTGSHRWARYRLASIAPRRIL